MSLPGASLYPFLTTAETVANVLACIPLPAVGTKAYYLRQLIGAVQGIASVVFYVKAFLLTKEPTSSLQQKKIDNLLRANAELSLHLFLNQVRGFFEWACAKKWRSIPNIALVAYYYPQVGFGPVNAYGSFFPARA